MAKKNNDYFKLIEQQTAYCLEASNLLEEILCKFNADSINAYRAQMHEIEHAADRVHHDILNRLSTEFITPMDQEDILHLVQIIDDITDALDEVVQDFYMYHIERVPEKAAELSKIVNRCVSALYEAAAELKNFKKPAALRALVVKVNDIETEADAAYAEAVYELFGSSADGRTLLGAREVFASLESCCDLCEHATEVIEQVIMKNT